MEKHKKKVLIVIGSILIIIAMLTIILGSMTKREVEEPFENENPNKVISTSIERLTDEEKFFGVQQIINDFYLTLANNNTDDLLNLLDTNYIEEKNINATNLYKYLESDYEMTSYVAKMIYYNPNSSVTYYFVNGYLIDIDFMGENYQYYENVNYLIIVDETTNNYQIRPIDNTTSILDYAKKYDILEKKIDNDFSFPFISVSEENKLTMYLNEFLNLLIYDSNRAYQLLDNNTQQKYGSYDAFKDQTFTIYSQFSSKIFSYSSVESTNNIIYSVKDDKQNNLLIYESTVMDYKISY